MNIKSIAENVETNVEHYFQSVFKGVTGKAANSLKEAVVEFVKSDIGPFALKGVLYANALIGQTNAQLRDAARADFVAAAKQAGHDLLGVAESELNLDIELAYTAFKAHLAA